MSGDNQFSGAPLPSGQQLVARDKWPVIGERSPRADDSPWTVSVGGLVECHCQFDLSQLASLPQVERRIDLHCVTRWSKPAVLFGGVELAVLLSRARPTAEARFLSFVARSERRHDTSLPLAEAGELGVLLALTAEGSPLAVEHGGPVRCITPGRYLYKSLKWLERIELLADDRLGFWERTAGYHNRADPGREERYIASQLGKAEAAALVAGRDLRGRELLGLDVAGHDLTGLQAEGALLRNANFSGCRLEQANFARANLSNARLVGADLRNASFREADLEGADLSEADLRGTDLRGAALTACSFLGDVSQPEDGPLRVDRRTQILPEQLEGLLPRQRPAVERALAVEASGSA
jgi:DMSO/TMAO reductase YedYZ molybdopterin-dependent catalytic subunit